VQVFTENKEPSFAPFGHQALQLQDVTMKKPAGQTVGTHWVSNLQAEACKMSQPVGAVLMISTLINDRPRQGKGQGKSEG